MDELYEKNAKIVYHFLFRACHDETLAEDLMQETFLKAMESLDRYDGSCKISTWLCQIARHLLYQHWKKEKRTDFVELDDQMTAAFDTEKDAIHKVELSEVLKTLSTLPAPMQEVVKLRALSDLPFKDIGEILGRSENWARVTYYRAKILLIKETDYDQKDRRKK